MGRLEFEDWEQRWKELFEKLEKEGYINLSSDERLWYNVRGFIDAINSGGIGSFYIDKWFENMNDTLDDLKKLEANNAIEMLNQVNELLPKGILLRDPDEISDVFANMDEQSEEFDEFLNELNEKFEEDIEDELETKLDEVVKRLLN
ncbi:DUF4375 domain-containing protein [Bacillus sp. RG28]|uniref:DUF4375 domain-containing protein n=1 Tax=Gottfriedia endophytica TaxID=2820819 RepID=A0A940NQW9_9BACI|nr:DUF4375 domain-containing protein [Gottfriedia endophytica]MBP0726135.1 DUF4375 domain-containing protein [Gottfriedia endophytica]